MAATITHSCYLLLALLMLLSGADCTTFTITNNCPCPYTIWPATLTSSNGQQLSTTGFELAPHASSSITAPAPWIGRIWGRTGCSTDSSGRFSCATGDCASGQVSCNGAGEIPPATLVEFSLHDFGDQDFYIVSIDEGFNLPVSVAPQGGSGPCVSSSCPANVNADCPAELAVKGSDGSTIACKSACLALNQPQYCCTGSFGTPQTCPPSSYANYFKGKCPQASSSQNDDHSSTFICSNPSGYQITFCP